MTQSSLYKCCFLYVLFWCVSPGFAGKINTHPAEYKVSVGDSLNILVYREAELSGTFRVDGNGMIHPILLEPIRVIGVTPNQIQDKLIKLYKDGYLTSPNIVVTIAQYRPVSIIGEVNNPGAYAYTPSMTVENTVALGGGYTYRANKSKIFLKKKIDKRYRRVRVSPNTRVSPGDIIEVKERFF